MNFHVLTLFPDMVIDGLNTSIIGRAQNDNIINVEAIDIRDYSKDKHRHVDDYPYGGGAGMVMQAAPICDAYEALCERLGKRPRVIYMTPQGRLFDQNTAKRLAKEEDLVLLCGHYEGVDERALEILGCESLSIGDYVLTGGELPAMVVIDAVSRMVHGVLTNEESADFETFEDNLLEYPQYTRPEVYNGMKVPEVIMSGHHANIMLWRRRQSLKRTFKNRPDLLENANLSKSDIKYVHELQKEEEMNKKELQLAAAKARYHCVDMVHEAASGHPGGSLGCLDVLTYLYFKEMNVDPQNPRDPDRDRFVMSKGHCSPALYPVLALKGFFPVERLKMFRKVEGDMSGHVEMNYNPGVDMSTGSLGQGISAAVGMALAGKLSQKNYRTYAILGEGEIAEGQVWEAFMSAAKYKLDNLCAVIDVNGMQIDGLTEDVMPSAPLDKKMDAFGWHVITIDGHDFDQIENAFEEAKKVKGQPTMILAKTTKGKGVSFMENNYGWHGKAPNDEEWATAKAELEAKIQELEG